MIKFILLLILVVISSQLTQAATTEKCKSGCKVLTLEYPEGWTDLTKGKIYYKVTMSYYPCGSNWLQQYRFWGDDTFNICVNGDLSHVWIGQSGTANYDINEVLDSSHTYVSCGTYDPNRVCKSKITGELYVCPYYSLTQCKIYKTED
jgi:hypothetical protein